MFWIAMGKMVVTLAVVLVAAGLSGCNQINTITSDKRFVGRWSTDEEIPSTFVFFSDGTCTIPLGSLSGIWRIKDGLLVIDIDYEPVSMVYTFEFFNNNRNLYLVGQSWGRYNLTKQ